MKGAAALLLKMAGPRPGVSFVLRNGDGQRMPSAGSVVVNEQPMAVAQAKRIEAGAGIRQFRSAHGPPREAAVTRPGDANAIQRPVLAHVSHQRSVLFLEHGGLDVAES